jgi:predicted aspartyl protease
MGRFSVEFEISNYRDVVAAQLGAISPRKIRRARIRGIVDTGASQLVLPTTAVKQLGLDKIGNLKVRYAEGRRGTRDLVSDVYLEFIGRKGIFNAVVEPKRRDALIGAIVLEALDLLPDCTNQRLVPRDPKGIFAEIE